jgi:hypothetical protein
LRESVPQSQPTSKVSLSPHDRAPLA